MGILNHPTRRSWLRQVSGAAAATSLLAQTPAIRVERPAVDAVMSGDLIDQGPTGCGAVIWARADKPSRMQVTWKTSEKGEAHVVSAPYCTEVSDFTGRVQIDGLPSGQ